MVKLNTEKALHLLLQGEYFKALADMREHNKNVDPQVLAELPPPSYEEWLGEQELLDE